MGRQKQLWKKRKAAENWRNIRVLSDNALLALSGSLRETVGMARDENFDDILKAASAQQDIVSKVLDKRGLIP